MTGVISHDQRRSNASCFLTCRLVDIFDEHYGFSDFSRSWAALCEGDLSGQIIATSHDLTPNGGLEREIPLFQGNLSWWNIIIWPDLSGRALKVAWHRRWKQTFVAVRDFWSLEPRLFLHRSQLPQKHAATGFVMMDKRIFGPHIGAGTESLYRSQYRHRDDPLRITTNSDPCFYWRWQGTTGLFFLLAEFTARYSQRCELSEALSLRPTLQRPIVYPAKTCNKNFNSWRISKSFGLILRLAHVVPCSVVTVRIHHEFNTKKCFFGAAHICSYLLQTHPNFEPNLFQWQVPARLNRVSWKQDTDKETSCKVYVGKTWQDCLEKENCTLARGKLVALKHPGFFTLYVPKKNLLEWGESTGHR